MQILAQPQDCCVPCVPFINTALPLTDIVNHQIELATGIVNVKSPPFNARGDGDGAGNGTDDTAAIQEALASISSTAGLRGVYFPPGIYNISAPLTVNVPFGLLISGAGAQVSQIYVTTAFSGAALTVFDAQLFDITNLSIVANKLCDRCLFLNGNNAPPLSVGRVRHCQFIGAINEGVQVDDDVVNNYQGDHIIFESCNFSQSKWNLVFNSGNAIENVILNCQFFGFGLNNPDYNIWFKRGSARILKASCYHAQLFDVRYGVGTYCNIDNFYSESPQVITTDTHSFFEYPCSIKQLTHNANNGFDTIYWDRNSPLRIQDSRLGGNVRILQCLYGVVDLTGFRTGFGLIGNATAIARIANIRSYQHNGATAVDLPQPFRANSILFGVDGNGSLYDNTSNAILQMNNGKGLIVYDNTASAVRMSISSAGIHSIFGIPVFANNAAAVGAGMPVNSIYRTGSDPDPVCVVH